MLNRLTIWMVHRVSLFAAKTPEEKAKIKALLEEIRVARKGMTWKERREADREVVDEMIKRAKGLRDKE